MTLFLKVDGRPPLESVGGMMTETTERLEFDIIEKPMTMTMTTTTGMTEFKDIKKKTMTLVRKKKRQRLQKKMVTLLQKKRRIP